MLVSLNKNRWLWKYIYERVDKADPELRDYLANTFAKTVPQEINVRVLRKFETLGYKLRFTSSRDVIISMKEEEYVYLKLKYE
jgi:hypothetical protein